MANIPLFIGMISAFLIFYQDLKSREIHLSAFLLFFLGGIGYNSMLPRKGFLFESLINLGMISAILLSVFLIFRLLGKSIKIDKHLGTGDLVMLGGLCFWFSPLQFISFYTLSLCLLSVITGILLGLKKIDRNYPIPLAGVLAVFFMVIFPFRNLLLGSFINSLSYGY